LTVTLHFRIGLSENTLTQSQMLDLYWRQIKYKYYLPRPGQGPRTQGLWQSSCITAMATTTIWTRKQHRKQTARKS